MTYTDLIQNVLIVLLILWLLVLTVLVGLIEKGS